MADETHDDSSESSARGDTDYEAWSGERPIPRVPPPPPIEAEEGSEGLIRGESPVPRVPPPEE